MGEYQGEAPQILCLLNRLTWLVNNSIKDNRYSHQDIKAFMIDPTPNPIFWSDHRYTENTLRELCTGLHFIHPWIPGWRQELARSNLDMVFDDTDDLGWSEKAQDLIQKCEDGRVYVHWEGEDIDPSITWTDDLGFVHIKFFD